MRERRISQLSKQQACTVEAYRRVSPPGVVLNACSEDSLPRSPCQVGTKQGWSRPGLPERYPVLELGDVDNLFSASKTACEPLFMSVGRPQET